MSESDTGCLLASRKMSVSSDSYTGDCDTVDSNVKIQINDITPSNSQEFLGPWDDFGDAGAGPLDRLRLRKRSIDTIKQNRKKLKKELVRRQSWSSLREDVQLQKPVVQKCWSLSSLDSDTEEIFYDARDGPYSPCTDTTDCSSQNTLVGRMRDKQRSFSAGSKEDILMAICEQVKAAHEAKFSDDIPVVRDDKKKHSLVGLTTGQPAADEEWLLAPRTPLQKSMSTPSIIAAQELQEMARRRDKESKERPLSTSFSTNQLSHISFRDSTSIAMLQEEDEPEEMSDTTILPQISLSKLLRQSLLGSVYQDSDDDKPFSKRKKRGSLFFRKKRVQ